MQFTELVTFEVKWKMAIIALCLCLFSFLAFCSFCLYYCSPSSLPFLCIVSWLPKRGFLSILQSPYFFFTPINIEDVTPFLNVFVLLIVLYYPIFVGLVRLLRLVTIFFIIATYFGGFWLFFYSFLSFLFSIMVIIWCDLFCSVKPHHPKTGNCFLVIG